MSSVLIEALQLPPEARAQYIEQQPALFDEMLAHIGHTNSEIRDQVNYRLFMELLSADQIPHTILSEWAPILTSKLGAFAQEAIFTRSFSALWLTAIVYADKQLQVLTAEQYEQIVIAATQLVAKETDLRSYIDEEQGWAHSVAHVTDLCIACVEHPMFKLHFAPPMLVALGQVMWKGTVFVDDEEERFTRLVGALIRREMNEEVLVEWVEQLFDRVEQAAYMTGYTPAWFKGRTNTLHFAKQLYFELKFSHQYDKLRGITSILIQRWLKNGML